MDTRKPAPEFPHDLEWVNTSAPPSLAHLRGRVALVWFWSYDSVNCWNLMRDLHRLGDKYHDGLTVIGVHCPKYPRQCANESVLSAVNRHGLRHAIVNDADFRLWQAYGINAWPSVALIDADGRLAAIFAGEGRREEIDAHIGLLLDEAALHDLRVYEPTPPALRPETRSALSFPGKVLVDEKFLYVADSGHNRVLECTHDGRVRRCFGSGNRGHSDGSANHACFDEPQGMARWGDGLYIADRGSHSVRRIDLGKGLVETVLGMGRAGRSRPDKADARSVMLNSPVDLAVIADSLFVAVAGQNQIWRFDLVSATVSVFAGSGELGLADGMLADACFAQPSGLAASKRHLVVADAAASAVRLVGAEGRVETIVGKGLYDFGDVSGARSEVRLQNPLAVEMDGRGIIHVADTYNHSIKRIDRESGSTQPLSMSYQLSEPQGLSLLGDKLWIANTNRHEIVCVDVSTGEAQRVPVAEW
ncbi:MAG: thioredoxin-like domain-containing protein [Dokdonella sp.]